MRGNPQVLGVQVAPEYATPGGYLEEEQGFPGETWRWKARLGNGSRYVQEHEVVRRTRGLELLDQAVGCRMGSGREARWSPQQEDQGRSWLQMKCVQILH